MPRIRARLLFARFLLALPLLFGAPAFAAKEQLADEVRQLVRGLIADTEAERDAARERLLKLAGPLPKDADRVLDLLPEPNNRMLPVLRARIETLRREIEQRAATAAIDASHVTLDLVHQPLSDVLAELEKQTGNHVVDNREQFGQQADARRITVNVKDQPFWRVIDEVLDQGEMEVYPFASDNELALIDRDANAAPRRGRAAYAGPFRFEATEVTAKRSLRTINEKSLTVEVEVAWEPRLRPIALSQPLESVVAVSESGTRLSLARPEQSIDIEVQPGGLATQLSLPFLLPTRETDRIASLKGQLEALVPGREVTFRFEQLTGLEEPIVQQRGGVAVSLHDVRKNGEIWELHMRLKVDDAQDALASHRGWVFQNHTFLVGDDDEPIDHAGFETTMQTHNELGIAYLFELPNGPEGLTWVYETPASIVKLPIKYELKEIELP